ncbi:hypothetical protein [Rugamonas rivuli]|uniref:Uncharacterized protein n=1 Tax=Rugamonas rivuli TaxID=2743358 RepID=A0A843SM29_9BURK|nr:hypothetical protein [Rugamonas rivuli]MQA23253.1 hypothetical protein [Rugamonas rivuli]
MKTIYTVLMTAALALPLSASALVSCMDTCPEDVCLYRSDLVVEGVIVAIKYVNEERLPRMFTPGFPMPDPIYQTYVSEFVIEPDKVLKGTLPKGRIVVGKEPCIEAPKLNDMRAVRIRAYLHAGGDSSTWLIRFIRL